MQIHNRIAIKGVALRRFVFLFCLVLLSTFAHAVALAAEQPGAESPSTLSVFNNPAHDIVMAGTVRQLVTTHTAGMPAGLQLMVDGPKGSFTASLGTNLSRAIQQSLSQGVAVQISGQMQTINGQEYLLGRVLTVSGNQIIIRNENGFFVHEPQHSRASVNNSALYRSAK
jgi:hypothetical protein